MICMRSSSASAVLVLSSDRSVDTRPQRAPARANTHSRTMRTGPPQRTLRNKNHPSISDHGSRARALSTSINVQRGRAPVASFLPPNPRPAGYVPGPINAVALEPTTSESTAPSPRSDSDVTVSAPARGRPSATDNLRVLLTVNCDLPSPARAASHGVPRTSPSSRAFTNV